MYIFNITIFTCILSESNEHNSTPYKFIFVNIFFLLFVRFVRCISFFCIIDIIHTFHNPGHSPNATNTECICIPVISHKCVDLAHLARPFRVAPPSTACFGLCFFCHYFAARKPSYTYCCVLNIFFSLMPPQNAQMYNQTIERQQKKE